MIRLRAWRDAPWKSNDSPRSMVDVNAHIANLAYDDDALRANLDAAGIVVADGMSIVWASQFLKPPVIPQRCNMTDAFRVFIRSDFPRGRAILIGGTQDQADRAADAINHACDHIHITDTIDGYLSTNAIEARLDSLVRESPEPFDYFFVGLGTPRSEDAIVRFAARWQDQIIWHIGGGTILFFAGDVKEAPAWMGKCGLQWVHRLVKEPRRMWRRYLIGNVVFVYRVMAARHLSSQRRGRDR